MAKLPKRPTKRRTTTTKKAGLAQIETKIAAALERGDFYQVSQMVRMVAERYVGLAATHAQDGAGRLLRLIAHRPLRHPVCAQCTKPCTTHEEQS